MEESLLEVDYCEEKYSYHGFLGYTVDVDVHVGVTVRARGRPLVSADGSLDSTGIMLWPASHLLCQYFVSCASLPAEERRKIPMAHFFNKSEVTMLEMGCGCGISSVVAATTNCASYIICTDTDPDALALCQKNISSFLIRKSGEQKKIAQEKVHIRSERLAWGNLEEMDCILSSLPSGNEEKSRNFFDIVIGADIVYPSTSGPTLYLLLQSVKHMLNPIEGVFFLSFISRDSFRSPLRLIQSCSDNGFKIDLIDQSTFFPPLMTDLPPLMGARLLCLRPCSKTEAIKKNESLGEDDCKIFPGIKTAQLHSLEDTSEEEWDAPPVAEGYQE